MIFYNNEYSVAHKSHAFLVIFQKEIYDWSLEKPVNFVFLESHYCPQRNIKILKKYVFPRAIVSLGHFMLNIVDTLSVNYISFGTRYLNKYAIIYVTKQIMWEERSLFQAKDLLSV